MQTVYSDIITLLLKLISLSDGIILGKCLPHTDSIEQVIVSSTRKI